MICLSHSLKHGAMSKEKRRYRLFLSFWHGYSLKRGAMSKEKRLIKDRIGELVGENQLEEATKQLCSYLGSQEDSRLDTARLLKRRLIQLEEREIKGIIAYEEADLQRNRISDYILRLARIVCEQEDV
jgi:uncharacterized protein YeeX (DUF496 family)